MFMSEYCIVRLNARQDDYSKIHMFISELYCTSKRPTNLL